LFYRNVEYCDNKEPNNKGYATVIIKVERNEFGPEFQPTTYTVTKNDYDGIGEPVVTVNAIDKDITVRITSLIICEIYINLFLFYRNVEYCDNMRNRSHV
jgi:hypothetical protein